MLGCTGMAPLAERVQAAVDVPVVEPMLAAFKTAETLARLGLLHAAIDSPGGLLRLLTVAPRLSTSPGPGDRC